MSDEEFDERLYDAIFGSQEESESSQFIAEGRSLLISNANTALTEEEEEGGEEYDRDEGEEIIRMINRVATVAVASDDGANRGADVGGYRDRNRQI
jgi:hypothetical protein